ncbi:hypothetical protein J27TS8_05400 [Robertmurraya siralis]|uniref:Uncharacterized protein n=1 Tax=Robertmurraya siralis TaxID=77777 RepID=A0A920BST3_9BACI|nr:hypothetical protein [Robertmurraya siralis]GIN60547.1 hypothetical protein J27TS8_05400 [Robertmurraya siralis]
MLIKEDDRKIIEQSILLPMLLTVLERDRQLFEQLPVKLKQPYLAVIEKTMKTIQKDLHQAKKHMKQNNLKAFETDRDESFTHYLFVSNRYEAKHSYFNPQLRNLVEALMEKYLNNM